MKMEIGIDRAGRVVLPQAVRNHFHLVAGDRLSLRIRPDGIFLQARSHKAHVVEENGLLVHEGEPTDNLTAAVESSRSGRDAQILGLKR